MNSAFSKSSVENPGAIGEQHPLFDSLPVPPPNMPRAGTLINAVAVMLREGQYITHLDVIDRCGAWRLAAYVHDLRKRHGWPIVSHQYRGSAKVYFIRKADLRTIGWA